MGKSRQREQHKIIIVGLPENCTDQDLIKLCRPFGNPVEATLAIHADGKPRGFGFVRFGDDEAQQAAILQLDKSVLQGRTLNVRALEERPQADRPKPAGGSARCRPCFDFARGKCAKGDACKWAHIKPPEQPAGSEASASRRPEWQKKRALDGVSADIPNDFCRKFQLGTCHRGAACRWKHIIWKGASSMQTTVDVLNKPVPAVLPAECTSEEAYRKRSRCSSAVNGLDARETDKLCEKLPEKAMAKEHIYTAKQRQALVEDLQVQLRRRESEWREAHAENVDAPIPASAKNKDLTWRAMERTLARLVAAVGPA